MDILSMVFQKILYASITASVIVLIILLVKRVLGFHLSVRLHHALWMIVLIRLLIPVAPASYFSIFNLYSFKDKQIVNLSSKTAFYNSKENDEVYNNTNEHQYKNNFSNSNEAEGSNNQSYGQNNEVMSLKVNEPGRILLLRLAYIWLIGGLIISFIILFEVFRFKLKIKDFKKIEAIDDIYLVKLCCEKLGLKRIDVYEAEYFKGPCITGLLSPKIYFPKDTFKSIDKDELTHILLHELAHYKRKDLILNMLSAAAAIIHWFNPIVWFAVSRMKLDRELACDAYVMEALTEGDNIEYGKTMLKLSKIFMDDKKRLSLANYYETKSHLERRIVMIKSFKKGAYKISFAALICCIILATTTLTNAVSPSDPTSKSSTAAVLAKNNAIKEVKADILIDTPTKTFNNIKRADEFASFTFKVPDYLPSGYEASSYQLRKVSDKVNVLRVSFENKENDKAKGKTISKENLKRWTDFSFYACSEDMTDALIKLHDLKRYGNTDAKISSSKEPADEMGGFKFIINGENENNPMTFTNEYYIWKNDNIWYAVQYADAFKIPGAKSKVDYIELSQTDIKKIAASIKDLKEIKTVNYPEFKPEVSTELGQLQIYDKNDLEQAKKMLSFQPKFPLTLSDGKKVDEAGVGVAYDSDIKNNKINYDLVMFYYFKEGSLTFYQQKSMNGYDDIKKNGHIAFDTKTMKEKRVKADAIIVNGKEVLVYKEAAQSEKELSMTDCTWKENDFLCSATFFGKVENQEQILKDLVNEKPLE